MASIYLSAASKSSGKTTISIGLAAEWRRLGWRVQPFKKGPDYIDPLWLARTTARPCINLDYHTMSPAELQATLARYGHDADLRLIEGNVGLFDSVDLHGRHSNAELAKLLGVPVVLILDVQGMSRGVAPLLLGYRAFDPQLPIAGVILNKVGGGRHEQNLRRVIAHYCDLPILGAVPRIPEIAITERHLGLMPSNEADAAEAAIERIRACIAAHVDCARIAAIAAQVPAPPVVAAAETAAATGGPRVRIAIAQDDAFGFYYPDDLVALGRAGADLIPFSPVHDRELPAADALFIGGGFPECRMHELEQNGSMRAAIADFIGSGRPAYAECGGLMYLTERLYWNGRSSRMCGVLAAEVAMHPRPQGRGYVRLQETSAFPWRAVNADGDRPGADPPEICAHEFHHSALVATDPDWVYGYRVLRGAGVDGQHDGIVHRNLLASYAHLRNVGGCDWTRRFVQRVRDLS